MEMLMIPRVWPLALLVILTPPVCAADPKPGAVPGVASEKDIAALEKSLRELMIRNAPNPLFEKGYNWGHVEWVPRGLEWHGLRPKTQYSFKEDGVWRKVKVVAPNLSDTLVLDIRNVRDSSEGPRTFDVFTSLGVQVFYDQQTWQNGHRLYAGSVRALLRVKVLLSCEMTSKLEFGKSLLPDVTFRLRVTKADLSYDNFKVEHAYGWGGDMAKMLGESAEKWLHERHPELERELLDKANAAIVKAADTKEIKLGLGSTFGGEPKKPEPAKPSSKKPN
jgi:hypothetical protein